MGFVITDQVSDAHPLVIRNLDSVGDGSGEENLAVDGSVDPVLFQIQPPLVGVIVLNRLRVTMIGQGIPKADTFGPIPALVNGCVVGFFDEEGNPPGAGQIGSLPKSGGLRQNSDWLPFATLDAKDWSGGNVRTITADIDLRGSGASALVRDKNFVSLGVLVRDDLTAITRMEAVAFGYSRGVLD